MELKLKSAGVTLMAVGGIVVALSLLKGTPFSAPAPTHGQQPAAHRPPPPLPPAGLSGTPDGRSIIVDNDTLSLVLHDQPLGPVLAEIARAAHVIVNASPEINARHVSIELQAVPLALGLQRLLGDSDVYFYSSAGRLRAVWIYDHGAGAALRPIPPESWASTADIERQLNDPSATQRMMAVQTLVARNGADAGDIVARALLDPDPEVRLRALDVALSAGVAIPRDTLVDLTNDAYPRIRLLALETIVSATPLGGEREAEVDQLMQRMSGDTDPEVRARAAELLASRHPAG
jgi:hypothetical protein